MQACNKCGKALGRDMDAVAGSAQVAFDGRHEFQVCGECAVEFNKMLRDFFAYARDHGEPWPTPARKGNK